MITYIIKRVALIFPMLIIISIIAFFMSKATPNDGVTSILMLRGIDPTDIDEDTYTKTYRSLDYHLPIFYFSIKPAHYPKNLNSYIPEDRQAIIAFLERGIDGKQAEAILSAYKKRVQDAINAGNQESVTSLLQGKEDTQFILDELELSMGSMKRHRFLLPRPYWHGLENQYHKWLLKAFNKDFGPSIVDGKSAFSKVGKALTWTLSFTLVDYFISLFIGLYLGLFLAKNPEGKTQKLIRQILYVFYAIPLFWLATLMVVYFTTDEYGSWTNWFSSVGMDIYPGKSSFYNIFQNFDKLILPIICLGIHSMAYVGRIIENALGDEMRKDYILMAMADGMSKKEILLKEALPNAMLPIITLFMSAFAAAFSGSLVLEVIFNIPGMGRLLMNSISVADWNVVFCILIVVSFVTIVAYLIADILYALFNPKIKFE